MSTLVIAIVIAAALVVGVAWFATKGRPEKDDHEDPDSWGGW